MECALQRALLQILLGLLMPSILAFLLAFAYYDIPASAVVTNTDITTPQALNSRKRVVSSIYKEAKSNTDYDVGTHYVYDINGNVKTLFQEHKAFIQLLPALSRTPRRVDYEYDLISRKVNKVHFQKDKNDKFSHKLEKTVKLTTPYRMKLTTCFQSKLTMGAGPN